MMRIKGEIVEDIMFCVNAKVRDPDIAVEEAFLGGNQYPMPREELKEFIKENYAELCQLCEMANDDWNASIKGYQKHAVAARTLH